MTALDFHPVDDKYFLSGSIDGKVNLKSQRPLMTFSCCFFLSDHICLLDASCRSRSWMVSSRCFHFLMCLTAAAAGFLSCNWCVLSCKNAMCCYCLQVRCWNIPDQKVVDWADVHEMVTAAAFSSEGSRAVVGTMRGKCRFYQVDTGFRLDYQAQIGEILQ